MLRYPQKIKAIEPDNADIRLLQQLVEQRRQLVEDKRRFVNRIINTLKQYYPQPLEWFSHRGSLLLCELIIRWPSLQQLKRSRRDTIRNFLNAKGSRAMALTEQRVVSIDNAVPLTTDPSVIEANALMATALATQIEVVIQLFARSGLSVLRWQRSARSGRSYFQHVLIIEHVIHHIYKMSLRRYQSANRFLSHRSH